jgi:hypothetical protein
MSATSLRLLSAFYLQLEIRSKTYIAQTPFPVPRSSMCLGSVPIGDRKSGFGLSESKTRFTRCLFKSELARNHNKSAAITLLRRSRTSDHPMELYDQTSELGCHRRISNVLTDILHLGGFDI